MKKLAASMLFVLTACHTSRDNVFTSETSAPQDGDYRVGAVPSEYVWAHAYGTGGYDALSNTVPLPGGDLLVSGSFEKGVNLGSGDLPTASGWTGFIARYDADGGVVWARTFTGEGNSGLGPIAVGPDGSVYGVGWMDGSIDFGGGTISLPPLSGGMVVVKFDTDGNFEWARALAEQVEGNGVSVAPDGNVYVTGIFWAGLTTTIGGTELSSTQQCTLLLKLDPQGATRWSRLVGASSEPIPEGSQASLVGVNSMVSDAQGVVLAGEILGHGDLGIDPGPTVGLSDALVVAYAHDGTPQWVRRFGSPGGDIAGPIALTSDGGLAIAGSIGKSGTLDGIPLTNSWSWSDSYLALLERDGSAARWARTLDIGGSLRQLSQASDGRLLAAGASQKLSGVLAQGAFVGTFSPSDGTMTLARVFTRNGWFQDAHFDDSGALLLTGAYWQTVAGTIDLGAGSLPSFGDVDAFVTKLRLP